MTTQDSDSAQDPRPEWQFEFYHSNSVIELDAALTRLKRLLDTHLIGRYALDVVDVTDHPDRAEREKITATPTFLLRGPRETRKLLGVPSTVEDIHFLAGHTATQKQTPMNRNGRPTGPPSPSAAGSTAANDQELQLARAKAQLSQARQEIDEQEATIERLQSVNAELKDFAYRFAHDAKGPLRTVRQMIAFVEEDSGDALTEESRGDLQRAVDIAARLSTLMDNTLTYARAGAAPLTMKSVDLGKLLNWVSTDLRAALIESGGSVDIGPMPKVAGEESELYRLFLNLLGNAIKYRRPDVAPFVKIWSEPVKNSKQVRVHISDNGIGFDDSYGRRIFEPFTRLVDNSKYEGSGLGLAIVNRTVERHGGSISAKAKLGEGSTFSITLPAAPRQA
ncbi:sensor histidine kinase [Tritonibacter horizontis]|uniref:histidine kinase n=1 Tax=Tritonibacter horizontis TaxID=1768241 RepID=A0A132BQ79_9RHOB|nr:ATP-binding protein [Tritonibacter horizontis]KUP90565.1 phytochrome-like protein cph1 [Tritonibacter horizontis]